MFCMDALNVAATHANAIFLQTKSIMNQSNHLLHLMQHLQKHLQQHSFPHLALYLHGLHPLHLHSIPVGESTSAKVQDMYASTVSHPYRVHNKQVEHHQVHHLSEQSSNYQTRPMKKSMTEMIDGLGNTDWQYCNWKPTNALSCIVLFFPG